MNRQLTETLGMLYDMELNNYLTFKSIEKIKSEQEKLGIPQKIERGYAFHDSFIELIKIYGKLCAAGGGALGAIIYFISGVMGDSGDFFGYLCAAPFVGLLSAIPGFVLGAIISVVIYSVGKNKTDKQNETYTRIYESKLEQEKLRIAKEENTKQLLKYEQKTLETRLKVGTRKLDEFYSSVGIAYSFRNLLAMSHMYEYAQLGISTQLEGVDGLYFLIKKEIQAEKLQYTLEEISSKLDTVIDRQSAVYNQLIMMNSKCDTMISETRRAAERIAENNQQLQQIAFNSSVAAYNTQRLETEMKYQNYIMQNYR